MNFKLHAILKDVMNYLSFCSFLPRAWWWWWWWFSLLSRVQLLQLHGL